MIIHIRCPHCGHKFREKQSVLGQAVPCPKCGQSLKVESGPAISNEAMFARTSSVEMPLPAKKPSQEEEIDREPSPWRNPAVWLAFATVLALVVIFVVVTYRPSSAPAPTAGSATAPPKTPAAAPAMVPSPESQASAPPVGSTVPLPSQAAQPERQPAPASAPAASSAPASPSVPPSAPKTPAPLPMDARAALSAEELFKRASPAVVRIVVRDEKFKEIGLGSGFFVSSDGILVTNYHVVAKARFATVVLPSEATLFVEGVLALDEQSDLAVLKVNGKDLPTLNLLARGETPAVGARIYAIGNPVGLSNTLSDGLVSGLRSLEPGLAVLQMTAPISPGSSGGPVLDTSARVVGVATLGSREGIQNLNFAVPAEKVHDILAKARENKPVPLKSAGGRPLSGQAGRDIQEAMQAVGEERWSDAVRILQGLRQTEPSNPQVWCVLGLLHTQLGNYDLALEAFREAVRLAPDLAIGHFGMGYAYQSQKRYAESVAAFQTAIRLSPDFWPAHTGLAMSLYEMRRYAESAAACTDAIRLRPDEAQPYHTLALNHLAMGDRVKAIEIYQTLLQLNPALAADLRSRIYRK